MIIIYHTDLSLPWGFRGHRHFELTIFDQENFFAFFSLLDEFVAFCRGFLKQITWIWRLSTQQNIKIEKYEWILNIYTLFIYLLSNNYSYWMFDYLSHTLLRTRPSRGFPWSHRFPSRRTSSFWGCFVFILHQLRLL